MSAKNGKAPIPMTPKLNKIKTEDGYTRPPQKTGKKDPVHSKFREEYYLQAYLFARQGETSYKIGKIIGVDIHTWLKWLKKFPALQKAIDKGYTDGRIKNGKPDPSRKANQKFFEYVYRRLPAKLQRIWDQVMELDENTPRERLEKCFTDTGKRERQHLFMHAFVSCNFVISQALHKVNISPQRFQRWLDDEDFCEMFEHVNEMKKDYVEGALFGLISQGDPNCTIYASKCLLKDRGYDPKVRVEHEHTGMIAHVHDKVALSDLESLDIDDQRRLLLAIREGRSKPKVINPDGRPLSSDGRCLNAFPNYDKGNSGDVEEPTK